AMLRFFSRITEVCAVYAMLTAGLYSVPSSAGEIRLSINGYDPVAYFTVSRPVQGKSDFEHVWHKALWRFSTAENRELFISNPEAYAPRFDGYCSMGVGMDAGHKDTVDPEAWAIVDGKLYVLHSQKALAKWREKMVDYIQRANANWPT